MLARIGAEDAAVVEMMWLEEYDGYECC